MKTIRIVLAVWTVYGLFFSMQMYLVYRDSPQHNMTLGRALASQMIAAAIWALGTFWVIAASRRWRIERSNWKRRILIHAGHCILFTIVLGSAHALVDAHYFRPTLFGPGTVRAFVFMADREINTYWVVVFITHAYDYYSRFRNVQLRASQLQTELANARLELLQTQIHPHFLFNTLNTISSVIHQDPFAADRMIANLGQFLRATLAQGEAPEVALREELELLDCYLQIQKVRFEDDLQIELAIAPDAYDVLVPTLILQPLAENAIKHGMGDGGRVTLSISARVERRHLLIQVRDSGGGAATPGQTGLGVGLANTHMRLQKMYGDAQSVKAEPSDGGFTVTLLLPRRAR